MPVSADMQMETQDVARALFECGPSPKSIPQAACSKVAPLGGPVVMTGAATDAALKAMATGDGTRAAPQREEVSSDADSDSGCSFVLIKGLPEEPENKDQPVHPKSQEEVNAG